MDSISQAALGAAIGEATLGRKIGHKGSIIGAIVATIPDLDVLLLPLYSSFQRLSIHRGYSHSILFTILFGLLVAYLLSKIKWTGAIPFARLYIFAWLVLFTHILLDGFTSYGTQMLLPFSDQRISFDSITIVDPIYTLPLLIGLGLSLSIFRKQRLQRNVSNYAGLIISSIYLMLTLCNKTSINKVFKAALDEQQIEYVDYMSVPVSAANVHWYAVAKSKNALFISDYSQIKRKEIVFEKFPINEDLVKEIDPKLIDRLKWASKNFYTIAEEDGKIRFYNMQCDMQGIRTFGEYKAPTAWYYEITPLEDGGYDLTTGMHPAE